MVTGHTLATSTDDAGFWQIGEFPSDVYAGYLYDRDGSPLPNVSVTLERSRVRIALKDSWRKFKAVFTRNPEPYAKYEYVPPAYAVD
jgi:hypothetical protein|tara:strand:- start:1761 stop:2021 length:261 start_codon:yes stop_codon:yes gene_type:complete